VVRASLSAWCRSRSTSFPAFFIAAAAAEGETLVTGAEELRVKESDRIAAMAAGWRCLASDTRCCRTACASSAGGHWGGTIDSRGDHRIAMAFAIASLRATATIEILDTANVATSFPGFAELANSVGLNLDARG
jgi:5-enolpyruvylshikimate-3-phosphate synthase